MVEKDLYFVISTYRVRDVGQTLEACDEHSQRAQEESHLIARRRTGCTKFR